MDKKFSIARHQASYTAVPSCQLLGPPLAEADKSLIVCQRKLESLVGLFQV